MPVIGNQGGGLTYDSAINIDLGSSGSYTVPTGKLFKGHIIGQSGQSNGFFQINGEGHFTDVSTGSTNNQRMEAMLWELGPNTVINTGFGNYVTIVGSLYNIG